MDHDIVLRANVVQALDMSPMQKVVKFGQGAGA
jgi:hypothetical protein